MRHYSVLQNFIPECLNLDPFPYIYIPQVLPWDLYEKLEAEYPEQHVTGKRTTGFKTIRYRQHEFDYENVVSNTWREFVNYNTSKEFKDELIKVFSDGIIKHYNHLYTKYTTADVSPRMKPTKDSIKMELQFVCNATDQVQIRTPHVDEARELFACLFYFKKPEDKIADGGLNIYKNISDKQWRRKKGREAVLEDIDVVDYIPYQRNAMICFLNTVDSLHGVTPRENPTSIRRYINISGHVDEELFQFVDN